MKKEEQNGKIYTDGIVLKGKTSKWLDNFWYHYKWVTVGVAFFLVVLIVCTVQMCTKEKYDLNIVYAGEQYLTAEEAAQIEQALEGICPTDFDGDGEKNIMLNRYYVLNEEQIKAIEATTDEQGRTEYVDRSYIVSQKDTYESYIQTGDASILLIDRTLYESLRANNRLKPLESALGYTPEGAIDEYGVLLGSTAFYREYGVVQKLPEDTVVCILTPYVIGKNSSEKQFAYEKQMFAALVKE